MKIAIAKRLRPFSHQPGIACLLPFSSLAFEVFPALIRISDLSAALPRPIAELPLGILGPVVDFTVIQDLERGCLRVFGHAQQGYFRYRIEAVNAPQQCAIAVEKEPSHGLIGGACIEFNRQGGEPLGVPMREKLCCGVSKAQNWQQIDSRLSLMEILPFWFMLGQSVPLVAAHDEGAAFLFKEAEDALQQRNGALLEEALTRLYCVGFKGMLLPQLKDDRHLGIALPPLNEDNNVSPLWLLQQGSFLIRSMLLQVEGHEVAILPCLLPHMHCGRLINARVAHFGKIAIEWSKKMIRRMIFTPQVNCDMTFHFPSRIEAFRLRALQDSCGSEKMPGEQLSFKAGESYLFDRFMS